MRPGEAHGGQAPGSPLQMSVSVSSIPSSPPSHLLSVSAHLCSLVPRVSPPPHYDLISFLLDKSAISVVIYRGVVFFLPFPSSYCDHSKPCSCPVPASRYQPFYHRRLDICTIDLTAALAAECHPPTPMLHVYVLSPLLTLTFSESTRAVWAQPHPPLSSHPSLLPLELRFGLPRGGRGLS